LLSRVGYRTVLWTQHPFYDQQADLKRGFQEFYRPASQDYATLPSQEELFSEKQPTFAFVHLIPPHTPYSPPPPHRGHYSAWYTGSIEPDVNFLRTFPERRSIDELTEDDRRFIRDRYDENVAFADAQVGSLLSMLDSAQRYEDALIILLSDHGEAFLEHERYLHSRMLHREFLHVPFVIKWPSTISGFRVAVAEPVSLVDGLSLPDQLGGYQGRSLIPVAFDSASRREPLWATTRRVGNFQHPPRPQQMLQSGPWKLLFDPLAEESQLYQVEDDPAETQDLSEELPMRTLALRYALQRQAVFNRELLLGASVPSPIEALDTELQEQLEALGYIE
jgi:arylsulfatase A-like enzyme